MRVLWREGPPRFLMIAANARIRSASAGWRRVGPSLVEAHRHGLSFARLFAVERRIFDFPRCWRFRAAIVGRKIGRLRFTGR